jgi:hypothetical protein
MLAALFILTADHFCGRMFRHEKDISNSETRSRPSFTNHVDDNPYKANGEQMNKQSLLLIDRMLRCADTQLDTVAFKCVNPYMLSNPRDWIYGDISRLIRFQLNHNLKTQMGEM